MTESEKLEIVLMAHKYTFSMYLKYIKIAENFSEDDPRRQKYLERARHYSIKSKELDYKIYIYSSPITSGKITLQAHTLSRWKDFISTEKDYREKLSGIQLDFTRDRDLLTWKKISGLIHNSAVRQASIEAMFIVLQNEYGL